mgnify:CR=1 FL=1
MREESVTPHELQRDRREKNTWQGRPVFIAAVTGSTVKLVTLWVFPNVADKNGVRDFMMPLTSGLAILPLAPVHDLESRPDREPILTSLPAIYSDGLYSQLCGYNFFDTHNYLTANVFMMLAALTAGIFCGYCLKAEQLKTLFGEENLATTGFRATYFFFLSQY